MKEGDDSPRRKQTGVAIYEDTKKKFDKVLFYMKQKGYVNSADELINLCLEKLRIYFKISERRYS